MSLFVNDDVLSEIFAMLGGDDEIKSDDEQPITGREAAIKIFQAHRRTKNA